MSRARIASNWSLSLAKCLKLFVGVLLPVCTAFGDITTNLIAHYEFDDETGTTAKDSSDKNHDGTLEGYDSKSSPWTTGKIGGALSFDGTDDYVTVPHNSDFNLKTYTLTAWVGVSRGSQVRPILVKGKFDDGVNSTDVPFALYLSAENKLTLAYEKAASSQRLAENMSYQANGDGLASGEIYHVAVTRNNSDGKVSFYIDGQLRGSFEGTPNPGDNKKKLYIGADPKTNQLFKGALDDVRIYSRSLGVSDIQALYGLGTNSSQEDSTSGRGSEVTNTSENDNKNADGSESKTENDDSAKTNGSTSGNGEDEKNDDSKNASEGTESNESKGNAKTSGSGESGAVGDGKGSDDTPTESYSQDTQSTRDDSATVNRDETSSPGESDFSFETSDSRNNSTEESAPKDDDGKDSSDSTPEQDDKRSEDASKQNDDEGTRSAEGDESSSQSGRGNREGKEDDKESESGREQESFNSSNQAPRNITLTKNSIYEGQAVGSIVGEFHVVDDDDPDHKDTYVIELITYNSSVRRVGRASSSNEKEDSAKSNEVADESKLGDLREGTGDDYDYDDGQKSTGREDSGKKEDSSKNASNESLSTTNSSNGEKETSGNSNNEGGKESSGEKDSGGGWFTIDHNGRLTTTQVLDYETQNSYSIRVRAIDKDGLSMEKDFVVQVKNAFVPIVRTGGAADIKAQQVKINGEILANGYSPINEVGAVISKQPRVQLNEEGTVIKRANRVSQKFDLLVKNLEPETTYYYRTYAINGEGASYSALQRFATTKSDNGPWTQTESIGNGWVHSEWLGDVYPTENNWVYHSELGWLYAKQNSSEGVWLYSKDFLGWFWTDSKVYPFVYSNKSRSWAYYKGIMAQHRVFFHFGQNSWMAVASDELTKKRESNKEASEKNSSKQTEKKETSVSGKNRDEKSLESAARQKR